MKRVISCVAGVAAVMAMTAGVALADPVCMTNGGGDAFCVSTDSATAGSGNPLAALTSKGPFHGIVALGSTTSGAQAFYVFADGFNNLNADPLVGYLGLNTADMNNGLLGLVGDKIGDFNRAGGNNPLLALLQSYNIALTPDAINRLENLSALAPDLTFLKNGQMPAIPDLNGDVLHPVLIIFGH